MVIPKSHPVLWLSVTLWIPVHLQGMVKHQTDILWGEQESETKQLHIPGGISDAKYFSK